MRIFLTVGHQIPFDRLSLTVDSLRKQDQSIEVFGQIGNSSLSTLNFTHVDDLPPDEFTKKVIWADVIVSHAGMGTIITALDRAKPIIVMPRRASLNETRNDHQVHTAKHFASSNILSIVENECELRRELNRLPRKPDVDQSEFGPNPKLIETISRFINQDKC